MSDTNFKPIDPNNEILNGTPWYFDKQNNTGDKDGLGIAPFEDIRSFVQLYMRPRNPNFIQLGDYDDERASFSIPQDNSIVVIGGHFKSGNNSYYSTNYTDELMGNSSTDNEKNYEGFGIKSVDITFDANKIPQITIVFYDLRGNVLNNFNSKYAKMFQLPYPKFVLDIKGGFGPLISYKIVKVRDDISIDEMGNYIITSKFIGDRFSPFSDLPLLYLMAVPYLQGKDVNSDFVNDNKITSFHELVINSKKLYEKVQEIKESDTEKGNQKDFAKEVEDRTNYEEQLKIFQTPDEFYKLFENIGENKDIVLKYIKTVVFDKKNNTITFPIPPLGFKSTDSINIKTIVDSRLKPINDPTKLVDSSTSALPAKTDDDEASRTRGYYEYISVINYSLLVNAINDLNKKVLEDARNNSQDNLIKISQIPSQVLGETRLTIGNIFRILIDDYNYLMNRIFEEGNKGYQEIITNNTNRTQQKFDKMGFPTVIQGNQIIYPGVIPEFQKWPEIVFIEQFIDAYYRSTKANIISDILLNKEEDGRQKYIPINPREYNPDGNIENVFYGKQLIEIYKLIYQRFLCFANVNINLNIDSKVYSTWTGSQKEEDSWKNYLKEFKGVRSNKFLESIFYSTIDMEARNIAYAISLNDNYKKAIKDLSNLFNNDNDWIKNNSGSELSRSIETITNNTLSIPSSVQPFDDNYVIVRDFKPTLIDANTTTSADYITTYMLKLNEISINNGYKITKDNILYIPDITLQNGNNDSIYDHPPKATIENPFNIQTLKQQIELNTQSIDKQRISELFIIDYGVKRNFVSQSTIFNFDTFYANARYTSVIEIPKGILIILGLILREQVLKMPIKDKYIIEIIGPETSPIPFIDSDSTSYNIKKDSLLYNYLISEANSFEQNYGFKATSVFQNNTFESVKCLRDDLTKKTDDEIIKYIYTPVYLSINDSRFITFTNRYSDVINGITNTTDSTPTLYKLYLKLLLKKITTFTDEDTKKLDDKLKSFTSYIKDPQVKLSIYKSFQVIYENYLHGVQKKDFEQVVSRDKNTSTFLFVDRGYNDISDLCILDIKTLLNDANDYEVSLFSSMARLLADNNFWFYPFQNFLTTENDYKDLFKINFDKKGKTKPKFVAMYVGGLSSNPNSPATSPIQDDGIKKDKIPDDLTNNGNGTGLNAFLVKYTGIQNQSVFSNLQVSTESLKNTDEGLRIQSEIIGNASNSFSIPKGQSLLNVYQKQSYSSTIKIPFGNAAIQPTQYYYQEYIPLFDGLYIIYNVTHNMDAETQRLETTFKGYRLKKDVNPIVTQEFVNFLNDDIYAQTLNDLSILELTTGTKLGPIRELIGKYESNGDYEIYNISKTYAIKSVTKGTKDAVKLTDKTLSQIIGYQKDANFDFFAVGKYQINPETLDNLTKKLTKDTTKFNANTQDTLCDSLLLENSDIGRYLNGKNDGAIPDLEKAVQAIAKIWAAMPVINKISGGNSKVPPIRGNFGDVVTGIGKKGYYGGVGLNRDAVFVGVNSVVQALITSRIQQCGVKPTFIPTYYIDVTNTGTIPNNDAKFATIGDSLSLGLTKYSKKIVKVTSSAGDLAVGGWQLNKDLLPTLKRVATPIPVQNLILSIGANDGYELTNIDKLINEINRVFPDSQKFIINGTYDWDRLKITKDKDDNYWTNKIKNYTDKYEKNGYTVLGEIVKTSKHPDGKQGDKFFDKIFNSLISYGIKNNIT